MVPSLPCTVSHKLNPTFVCLYFKNSCMLEFPHKQRKSSLNMVRTKFLGYSSKNNKLVAYAGTFPRRIVLSIEGQGINSPSWKRMTHGISSYFFHNCLLIFQKLSFKYPPRSQGCNLFLSCQKIIIDQAKLYNFLDLLIQKVSNLGWNWT